MAKSRRENTEQTQPNREGVNPRSKHVIRVGQAASASWQKKLCI